MLQKSTGWHSSVLLGTLGWVLTRVLTWVLTRVAAGRHWAPLGAVVCCWALLGAAGHICANFATCSWEPLTMLNPQFVAGEHGLFGGHKSEDIGTFLSFKIKSDQQLNYLCDSETPQQ